MTNVDQKNVIGIYWNLKKAFLILSMASNAHCYAPEWTKNYTPAKWLALACRVPGSVKVNWTQVSIVSLMVAFRFGGIASPLSKDLLKRFELSDPIKVRMAMTESICCFKLMPVSKDLTCPLTSKPTSFNALPGVFKLNTTKTKFWFDQTYITLAFQNTTLQLTYSIIVQTS